MTATTTGMDLWALRLACAYGLKPTAKPREIPGDLPLFCDEDNGDRHVGVWRRKFREFGGRGHSRGKVGT